MQPSPRRGQGRRRGWVTARNIADGSDVRGTPRAGRGALRAVADPRPTRGAATPDSGRGRSSRGIGRRRPGGEWGPAARPPGTRAAHGEG